MSAPNETSNGTASGTLDVGSIVYITGEVLISVLTAGGNALVLAAIGLRSELRTITNYFVASLAAADFLVGVFAIPCAIVAYVGLEQDYISCTMVNVAIIILTQISTLGLCAVAVERFVAIKYPYKYAESCTVALCAGTIAGLWATAIVVGIVPLFVYDKSANYDGQCRFIAVIDLRHMVYVHFFICTLGPLVFMFATYCYIFHVVRQQVRKIAALQQAGGTGGKDTRAFKKDTKAAKWFAVVILLFAASWLPLDFMNVVTLYGGPTCQPCLLVAIILSHANSAINPILYAFANSRFKIAFRRILHMKQLDDEETLDTQNT